LAEGQAERLIQKVVELAEAGDIACLRMCLDRLWPIRKGQPLKVDLPAIDTPRDMLPAIASVWNAVREGRVTPEEAGALSFLIDRSLHAIELESVVKRVEALESARKERKEETSFRSAAAS
jgi:hypothetical protein